jgi:hypothetical protein
MSQKRANTRVSANTNEETIFLFLTPFSRYIILKTLNMAQGEEVYRINQSSASRPQKEPSDFREVLESIQRSMEGMWREMIEL